MSKRTTVSLSTSFALCAVAAIAAAAGSDQGGGRQSGVQITPDELYRLVSKDIEQERWAVTRNPDGTVTGNVFFRDGRDPIFVYCAESGSAATEVMLHCLSAGTCDRSPCPADAWTFVADVSLPIAFFSPPGPPLPTGPLGRRRFSIDPSSSFLRSVTVFGPDEAVGFSGFIDLEATAVDPATGQARVDVVGASELITLDGVSGAGPIVICVRPRQDQFPVVGAGVVDCDGGTAFGYSLAYDHDIGTVGVSGFTAQQCTAAMGVVEGSPHAGVCNSGPMVGSSSEDTGPGGLILAQIPGVGNPGFMVSITTETSLPCGDEGPPVFEGALPLTTGRIVTTLHDVDDVPGAMLQAGTIGSNFSCANWRQENGPGTLTLSSVTYDLAPAAFPGLTVDVISAFVLDD